MDKSEYEKAWEEGDQDGKPDNSPAENAVAAAGRKAMADAQDEFLTAFAEDDEDNEAKDKKDEKK